METKVRFKEMRIVEHDENFAMVDVNELRMLFVVVVEDRIMNL